MGKNLVLIVVLVLVNKIDTYGNVLCYLALFAMTLTSPAGALKALSISGLLVVAGTDFVIRGEYFNYLKFSLLLVAGLVILRAARNPLKEPFLAFLLAFGLVAAILAVINGYFVDVSLLKIGSFTFGTFCLLSVARIPTVKLPELTEWTVSLILAAALMSYLVLATGNSYGTVEVISGRRFSGHLGMFSHPQTLGLIAALFSIYLTGLLLFFKVSHRKFIVSMLASWLVLVYLSEARTGVYGYILATGITVFLLGFNSIPLFKNSRSRINWNMLVGPVVLGLLALITLEASTGLISDKATEFIKKKGPAEDITLDTFYVSREDQIARSWQNFQENPATGIGFGTDLNAHWQRKATLLSASTEKGFLPTALLEEVGLVGVVPFLLFVFSLYGYLIRSRCYLAVATVTGLLVANLGEMVFFAFGGVAMLAWSIVSLSMAGAKGHTPSNQKIAYTGRKPNISKA